MIGHVWSPENGPGSRGRITGVNREKLAGRSAERDAEADPRLRLLGVLVTVGLLLETLQPYCFWGK